MVEQADSAPHHGRIASPSQATCLLPDADPHKKKISRRSSKPSVHGWCLAAVASLVDRGANTIRKWVDVSEAVGVEVILAR